MLSLRLNNRRFADMLSLLHRSGGNFGRQSGVSKLKLIRQWTTPHFGTYLVRTHIQ